MKITFYIYDMAGGGAERVFLNLINFCVKKGFSVELILNRYEGPNLDYLHDDVSVKIINSTSVYKSVTFLSNYLRRSKPDVVFSTLSICNFILILSGILSLRHVKIIIREANSFLSQRKKWPLVKRIRDRLAAILLYRFTDKIVVNSEGSKNELIKAALIDSQCIDILPNPVDFSMIKEKSKEPLPAAISMFLQNSDYFVSVGRLERAKGFDILIKSYGKADTDKKLVIIGEGSQRKKLELLINELNLSKKVLLAGYAANPYSIIQNSGVFVLSSRFEGMPNVLIEALVLDKPIISTDCKSGPREILVADNLGILVPVEDIESLTKALEAPPLSPDKQAVNYYLQRFDKEKVGQKFIDLVS